MQEQPLDYNKAIAELCKRSFYRFFCEFWDEINTETLIPNWHIKYLCDELQIVVLRLRDREKSQGDYVINVPPGTSKSNICTQLLPAWAWIIDPSLRVLTCSYSSDLSTEHATKSRDVIISERYRLYFPDIILRRDKLNKTNYENTKGGQRFVTSVGGTATGMHAHLIVVDDPLNARAANSEPERVSASDFVSQTLSTRKVDKEVTTTITVMQRLHYDDPSGVLLAKKANIHHICLPAELTGDVMPVELADRYIDGMLDPVRLSREVLTTLREDLGSYGYSGQILQRPSPEGGGLIKSKWFPIVEIAPSCSVDLFIDGAFTDKTYNDPTAIMVCCNYENSTYVLNSITKHLELYELVKFIKLFANSTANFNRRGSSIYIEEKASGSGIISLLNKDGFNCIAVDKKFIAQGKMSRVQSTAPTMEAGRVKILKAGWNADFFDECDAFPNGRHDDQVDNLTAAINRYNSDVDFCIT